MDYGSGQSVAIDVAGYAGGWLRIGTDTTSELQNSALTELAAVGMPPAAFLITAGDDLGARIFHNTFPYRAQGALRLTQPMTDGAVRELVAVVFERLTGQRPTVSLPGLGEPSQILPEYKLPIELPSAGTLNVTLALMAVVVIGLVVVLTKVRP